MDDIDALALPPPISGDVLAWSDAEIERRALSDPDAGILPDGFWNDAEWVVPDGFEAVTLVLPAHVLAHFRAVGPDARAEIVALLTRHVDTLTPATDP